MPNIKKRLSSQKANKLFSDDIKNYIISRGNTYWANALIDIGYELIKKNHINIVDYFLNIEHIVDSIYMPINDSVGKISYLYGILLKCYYEYHNIDLIRQVATIPYYNKDFSLPAYYTDQWFDDYCRNSMFYMEYQLYCFDISQEIINKIRYDQLFYLRAISTNNTLTDQSIFREIITPVLSLSNLPKYKIKKMLHEIVESTFIQAIFDRNLHLRLNSMKSRIYNMNPYLISEFVYSISLDDCIIDSAGYISSIDKKETYYSNFLLSYSLPKAKIKEGKNNYFCYAVYSNAEKHLSSLQNIEEDIEINTSSIFIGLSKRNMDTVQIMLSEHTLICTDLDSCKKILYVPFKNRNSYSILFINQTTLYLRKNNKSWPISLKDFVRFSQEAKEVYLFFKALLHYIAINFPFFLDVERLLDFYLENKLSLSSVIPIKINDCFLYKDWNDYFKHVYRTSSLMKINFNRLLPAISYVAIKVYPYISQQDLLLFLSRVKQDIEIVDSKEKKGTRNFIIDILTSFYRCKLDISLNEDSCRTVSDWINMSMDLKIPISLKKKSYRKIIETHDRILLEKMKKANIKGHSIIAKNSVFNNLRSLLPKDFEWITTDQRLHLESAIQKHCVWSYKDKIMADECTIYSYVFPDTHERHTIEFRENKNQYKVVQIQKYCDRGYDPRIKEYLNRLIENCCK